MTTPKKVPGAWFAALPMLFLLLSLSACGGGGGGSGGGGAQAPAPACAGIPISSYDDDPTVGDATVECLASSSFHGGADGRPILMSDRVKILDEPVIYRQDRETGEFKPFATNPWPCAPLASDPSLCTSPVSNARGDFVFPDEPRFPGHEIDRDAEGRPALNPDGLQVWKPRDHYRGMTTAFEALHAVRDAAEFWSGRELRWGIDNQMEINPHAFVDFNAFFAPSAKGLFFGVVPYRLPGETEIKMFEMASSWEVAAHEAGHALHHELKPNRGLTDQGYRTWGESFGDQLAMWTSLRDADRVRALLAETDGVLRTSNALTRMGEIFAFLVGEGTGLRDAFHNKTVSTTSDQVHERSEVLTGASYNLFQRVYDERARERGAGEPALMEAGTILGTFLTRAADYTPENQMTLKEVAKAYLKVDKELFGGRFHTMLVSEFVARELFDAGSMAEWEAHEAAVPALRLAEGASQEEVAALVQANLDTLGIGPAFGLALQSVIRDTRLSQTILRVQLTQGRGTGATPLANHGVLVFRADGTLADYHAPLFPTTSGSQFQSLRVEAVAAEALTLMAQARQVGLERRAPLALVRAPDGRLSVEAHVLQGPPLDPHVMVYTLANPQGERREIIPPRDPALEKTRKALLERGLLVVPKALEGRAGR